MIYRAYVEPYYTTPEADLNTSRMWEWSCDCGKKRDGYSQRFLAELALDRHLRTHERDNEPGRAIKQLMENDEQVNLVAPIIAVDGAPSLLAPGDEVIGVSGSLWIGKRGKVVDISITKDIPNVADGQEVIHVKFHDPIEAPARAFAPAHAREDDMRVPDEPPTDNATNDAHNDTPVDPGSPDDVPPNADNATPVSRFTGSLMGIIPPGNHQVELYTNRWDLFNDAELSLLHALTSAEARRAALPEGLREAGSIIHEDLEEACNTRLDDAALSYEPRPNKWEHFTDEELVAINQSTRDRTLQIHDSIAAELRSQSCEEMGRRRIPTIGRCRG